MIEITVLSGKGGAGKTSIVAALASVLHQVVFCDNDVDAADLHLIFKPQIIESYHFNSGATAEINTSACLNCGLCKEYCRFSAIQINKSGFVEVNNFRCEGCQLCEHICPTKAISMKTSLNNRWFVSETRFGKLVHAKMKPGEENSGRLVSTIRSRAREIAFMHKVPILLNDGPPGIGCSAIASVTGTDAVLLVIEPSISGFHDAKRLLKLVQSFRVPTFAIINKYDINPDFTKKVEQFLHRKKIQVWAKLPFSEDVVQSIIDEKTPVEYAPNSEISKIVSQLATQIQSLQTAKCNT